MIKVFKGQYYCTKAAVGFFSPSFILFFFYADRFIFHSPQSLGRLNEIVLPHNTEMISSVAE